ncbi:hypothetical protein SEMRO_186_G080530.1 [Seminavis robusta]|uniref:Uncharacterized protein n=1 Tax=Seminavis robusta TaxID=568900 RepID=A0A9N8DL95_9STRA|nr:hypothetical protein SEMRO_186_G080530.1 [Seminavis robusta]|eukprot:Sro186_g080530.1 n/a (282) ;mRNA; f:4079-4924
MPKPLPRMARIIPLIFSEWNSIKGGSDATTQLLWHCHYNVPSNENQAVVCARMLSLAAVHIHRLHQLSTANRNLSVYASLKRYRDTATERCLFKKSLNMIIDEMSRKKARAVSPQQLTPPRPTGRSTRSQLGILRLDLPLLATSKTPQRSMLAKIGNFATQEAQGKLDARSKVVLTRTRECSGFAVFRIGANGETNGKGGRGRCANCGSQTHCYCMMCKLWLCDGMSDKVQMQDDFKGHIIVNDQSDSPIHVQNCCFLIHHRKKQESVLRKFNEDAMKKMI